MLFTNKVQRMQTKLKLAIYGRTEFVESGFCFSDPAVWNTCHLITWCSLCSKTARVWFSIAHGWLLYIAPWRCVLRRPINPFSFWHIRWPCRHFYQATVNIGIHSGNVLLNHIYVCVYGSVFVVVTA